MDVLFREKIILESHVYVAFLKACKYPKKWKTRKNQYLLHHKAVGNECPQREREVTIEVNETVEDNKTEKRREKNSKEERNQRSKKSNRQAGVDKEYLRKEERQGMRQKFCD